MPGMPAMDHMKMRMHGAGMGGMGGHMFDKADANHDGRVSLAEAQALALAHFDRADVNHDGRVTREERKQVRQIRSERRTS
jgi:EF hand